MAAEIQQAATVRGKKRFSFATYTGILSGSTRTFRDSGEAEIPVYRRFSLGGQNNRLAGATRTFRDPQLQVDAFGAKITGAPAQPPTRGRTVASTGNYSPIQQDDASELPVTAAGIKPPAAAAGRRKSLQEWLTTKTNYSAVQTAQASELLAGGTDKKDGAISHQECPAYDSGDGDGNSNDNKSNQVHGPSGKFQPTHEDTRRLGGDSDVDNYKQGHAQFVAGLPHRASSGGINASEDRPPINEPAVAIDDGGIYASTPGDEVSQQVTFSSGTMGLTLDMSDLAQPREKHADRERYPASPCSGEILESSPRYGSLQVFRKEMAFNGINAQMYHTGWKGSFLPPRDIRLFMSDSRKHSVLYWRYKRKTRGLDGNSQLGAEDRVVIPLSSLANIGPAELYTSRSAGALSSWLPMPSSLRRTGDEAEASKAGDHSDVDGDAKKACSLSGEAEAPVLALSYWAEGEPRWVGDRPKRLLVKPDSLDAFRRLTNGLRLCCLHFHNYSCPQDLEDIR